MCVCVHSVGTVHSMSITITMTPVKQIERDWMEDREQSTWKKVAGKEKEGGSETFTFASSS